MKLAFSGVAAAVMLAVLPAAQAADRGQSFSGRQAHQSARVAQSSTTAQTRTFAPSSGNPTGNTHGWNRGGGGSAAAGGSATPSTGGTAGWQHRGEQHAGQTVPQHGWNQGGRQFERHAQFDGRRFDNGRHFGWEHGQHRGWYDNRGYRGYQGNINQREAFQRDRIAQAQRSGELTRGESRALWSEQRRIENLERDYRSDGRFTAAERADIQRRLDMSQRHIYQESHDMDRRY